MATASLIPSSSSSSSSSASSSAAAAASWRSPRSWSAIPPACRSPSPAGVSFPLTSPSGLGLRVSRRAPPSPSPRFPVPLSSARQLKGKMVHRIIDEIAEEYAGKIRCFLLNTDNDLDIAEDYDIKAVPVVLLFKNGQKRESVVGTMPKDFYVAAIQRVMDS
ncbi:hypothetical protein NL676_038746 [Syzygium grande]|nr:hypothetical protein NL676_038746 [Syzygium grande]